jgi:hypothetical protein
MADEKKSATRPPYVSYRTFRDFVASLRVAVPGAIERAQLKTFSGAVQTQLLHSLRYFGLIADDGTVLPNLEKLAMAEGAERQKLLQQMLRGFYPYLFSGKINLHNATTGQLQTALENEGVGGDTVRKCAAFFIAAAKDAGITLSPFLKVPRKAKTKNGIKRRPSKAEPDGDEEDQSDDTSASDRTDMQVLIGILSNEMTDEQKQAVWTLIQYLKQKE